MFIKYKCRIPLTHRYYSKNNKNHKLEILNIIVPSMLWIYNKEQFKKKKKTTIIMI